MLTSSRCRFAMSDTAGGDRAQMRAAPEAGKAIKKQNCPLNHINISRVAAFLTTGGSRTARCRLLSVAQSP